MRTPRRWSIRPMVDITAPVATPPGERSEVDGGNDAMRAIVYDRYGSTDVLRIADVPVPQPGAGQVRVRIAATSVNLSDWEGLRGSPLYARIGGLRAPARRTLGSDIAGRIEGV